MKKHLGILIIVHILFMLTACQQQNEASEKAPLEDFFTSIELTQGEYSVIFKDVIARAEQMNIEDEALKKWVIRALGDEKLMNKRDLTETEAIQIAKENQAANRAWISLAETKYEVTVSEKELDDWIAEGPDQLDVPQHKAYAAALGLTIEELNHNFDRDLHKQRLVWEKLLPALEDEYHTADQEELLVEYQNEMANLVKD